MDLKRYDEVKTDNVDTDDDVVKDFTDEFSGSGDVDDFSLSDDFSPESIGDDFGGMNVSNYEKHNDLLKIIMDFDSYRKQLINGWLGLVWDEEQTKFVKDPNKRAIMNTGCAAWCSSVLITYARANNVITTIDGTVYNEIMVDAGRDIYINLRSRSEEFGIKNQGDAGSICTQMINTIKLMLSGLGSGKMSEVLKTTVSRNESVMINDNGHNPSSPQSQVVPPRNKGVLGFMNKIING